MLMKYLGEFSEVIFKVCERQGSVLTWPDILFIPGPVVVLSISFHQEFRAGGVAIPNNPVTMVAVHVVDASSAVGISRR